MFGRRQPDVLVVGAGPVGLFAALRLAQRGVNVQIVDKEWRPAAHSYALALHPRSLTLLQDAGLLSTLLDDAYRVDTLGLYDGAERRAELRLSALKTPLPFVAVTRQDVLENCLDEALRALGVKVRWNHRVAVLQQADHRVAVTIDKLEKTSVGYGVAHTEWVIARTKTLDVPFVIGADGHRSDVRRALGFTFPETAPAQHFAVFEFHTDADLQHEMRIVMDDHTTNVLWPLPDGRCRWSFQLTDESATAASRHKLAYPLGGAHYPALSEARLRTLLQERAPWFDGSIDAVDWRLAVRFESRLVSAFGQQRLWLAGDAGHMTGPVGIQSMNVGLREAHDLADHITAILLDWQPMAQLQRYQEERQAEWQFLLGQTGGLQPTGAADPWVRRHAGRLLPCLPASGDDLTDLAEQLGLTATPVLQST